jgi:hypothetical protein
VQRTPCRHNSPAANLPKARPTSSASSPAARLSLLSSPKCHEPAFGFAAQTGLALPVQATLAPILQGCQKRFLTWAKGQAAFPRSRAVVEFCRYGLCPTPSSTISMAAGTCTLTKRGLLVSAAIKLCSPSANASRMTADGSARPRARWTQCWGTGAKRTTAPLQVSATVIDPSGNAATHSGCWSCAASRSTLTLRARTADGGVRSYNPAYFLGQRQSLASAAA